jgi:4-amino-4-deoxy-L-arabinose transferase-like glycosyltransferase
MGNNAAHEMVAGQSKLTGIAHHAVIGLLLIHGGLVIWIAARTSATADEVGHLVSGISHWHLARFESYSVNPPLVRSVATLPLLLCRPQTDWFQLVGGAGARPEGALAADFLAANGVSSFWYLRVARWACVPFSLLGGYLCYRWASELYGSAAGVLATTLWCFSPDVLGHAGLITPDIGGAALGLAAMYAFHRWLRNPNWYGAAISGVVLGLAELSKSTLTIFFLLLPALWLLWLVARRLRGGLATSFWQLCLIISVAIFVLNLGYLFDGSLTQLKDYQFVSRTMTGDIEPPEYSGNRFRQSPVGLLPLPFPKDYVRGIDIQKKTFDDNFRPNYLRGEFKSGGWWYYFVYALAVKVPLGTWVLGLTATAFWLCSRNGTSHCLDLMTVLLPATVIFVLVSWETGSNGHFRYLLPAFPFAFIFISSIADIERLSSRWLRVTVLACLVWSTVSSLSLFPHSLAYFNEAAGGPRNGHAHLLGSTLDWGQDLLFLESWVQRHPEAKPLSIAYHGPMPPELLGLRYTIPPSDPRPGWYAVSVNLIRGHPSGIPDGVGGRVSTRQWQFSYFQQFEPVAMAGYSIYIYHLKLGDANCVRSELGLVPLDDNDLAKESG